MDLNDGDQARRVVSRERMPFDRLRMLALRKEVPLPHDSASIGQIEGDELAEGRANDGEFAKAKGATEPVCRGNTDFLIWLDERLQGSDQAKEASDDIAKVSEVTLWEGFVTTDDLVTLHRDVNEG